MIYLNILDFGGFDHADIHIGNKLLYVAHTANDSLDIIDCINDKYLRSVQNLNNLAGVLVCEDANLLFTSNMEETTVSIIDCENEAEIIKLNVGSIPNGLAYDMKNQLLLCGNIGDPATVSIVDVHKKTLITQIPVLGRTRWTIYDSKTEAFYVNVDIPSKIAVIKSNNPTEVFRYLDIPATGPHGLALDRLSGHLYCACDSEELITLNIANGEVVSKLQLNGRPDVCFHNDAKNHLYVATGKMGKPGAIEVIDTTRMEHIESLEFEEGTHTLAFNAETNKVYAFLPQTHRAEVLIDL